MRSGTFVVFASMVLFAAASARAEWQEPKDGLLTEKQITAYIAATREIMQNLKAAGKAVDGTNNPVTAMQVYKQTEGKMQAAIAKQGLAEAEYQWVAGKIWEARGSLYMTEIQTKAEKEIADRTKKSAEEIATLKQKVATYEQAAKSGRRVMTAEERNDAIKSAKEDQKAADEEAKSQADAVKEATEAATKSDAEAKAADDAAKNPPKDLAGDDRQAFIEEKKQAAESARTAAKEAREKLAEENKALAEAKAKSTAAAAKAANPDVPVTPEEKADVKKQTDEALAAAKAELQTAIDAEKLLKESADQVRKQFADMQNQPGAKNAKVVQPHVKEFDEMLQSAGGK